MPFYTQPSSAVNSVLGAKCFAYSTLNALRQKGVVLALTTQALADTFVQNNFSSSMGGGPGQVLTALNLTPKQYAVQYTNHFINRCLYANNNVLPVVLATTVTTGSNSSNHWIYMTGMGAGNASILAEDQQNPARGTLTFALSGSVFTAVSGSTTYTLNNVNVFILTSAQRTALDGL